MGLLDSVIGSVTGSNQGGSSSTSPLVKALLLLLAAKAVGSHFGGSKPSPAVPSGPAPDESGKITSGVLAGLPSLDSMLDHFRGSGDADKVESWIGAGPNKGIAPTDLGQTLGPDTIDKLVKETGLPREELLRQLSAALPQVVDKLSPDGHLPGPQDRSHW